MEYKLCFTMRKPFLFFLESLFQIQKQEYIAQLYFYVIIFPFAFSIWSRKVTFSFDHWNLLAKNLQLFPRFSLLNVFCYSIRTYVLVFFSLKCAQIPFCSTPSLAVLHPAVSHFGGLLTIGQAKTMPSEVNKILFYLFSADL